MGFWTWYWEQEDADEIQRQMSKRAAAPATPRRYSPFELKDVPQNCEVCGVSLVGQTRSYKKCDSCFLRK